MKALSKDSAFFVSGHKACLSGLEEKGIMTSFYGA
jgi:hypothetical protein